MISDEGPIQIRVCFGVLPVGERPFSREILSVFAEIVSDRSWMVAVGG